MTDKNKERTLNDKYIVSELNLKMIELFHDDIEEVAENMEIIRSRPYTGKPERDYQDDNCIWMTPEEEEKRIRKHEQDKVLEKVISTIRKKVYLPTNSGEQISCDASIRLGIIHDLKEEFREEKP